MTALEFSYQLGSITKALKPFAMKLTKDYENANDLLQDTLIKAYTNRSKFEDGTNLKAWLYTIMKNTFITNYQKMVKRNTFIDTTDNLHFIDSSESSTNFANTQFALNDINKALEKLENCYRSCFMMYFNGYKYHEIAEELDIPLGTVKNRIFIARKELQLQLQMYA
ncbi:MAG: RNA polymerase sigma factor [Pseudarcicella sp.]|nr:RNA polymerase sigma factor [Pseudarcicella sp.]MBP6411313.1 RNA polymerase sigma factor [Pseudarcicella sp.]